MAAVPITLVGIQTGEDGKSQNVTIVGMASLTGLSVGGGPVTPPPGIWPGPGPLPHPEHPIVIPPEKPEKPPVGIWPGPGPLPHPEHPIVLPDPPTEVPPGENLPDGMVKDPPPEGGWGYNRVHGWGYFPGPTTPGPKKG